MALNGLKPCNDFFQSVFRGSLWEGSGNDFNLKTFVLIVQVLEILVGAGLFILGLWIAVKLLDFITGTAKFVVLMVIAVILARILLVPLF